MACITIGAERKGAITIAASLVCPVATHATFLVTAEGYYLITSDGKYLVVSTENE